MRPTEGLSRASSRAPQGRGMPLVRDESSSATAKLQDVDRLLGLIEEAVGALRSLLRDEDVERVPVTASAPSPLDAPKILGGGVVYAESLGHLDWDSVVRSRIRERFSAVGQVGAGVFLRLLRTPGAFVSVEDLALAAGVRANSNRVIKVYVCRLRQALALHGLPNGSIETGRRSYSLQSDVVPRITALLTHD